MIVTLHRREKPPFHIAKACYFRARVRRFCCRHFVKTVRGQSYVFDLIRSFAEAGAGQGLHFGFPAVHLVPQPCDGHRRAGV
jgi:hypothetical protein